MLTSYTALDPSFGSRGQVFGAVDNGSGTNLSISSAVSVQSDGKIVVVGTFANPLRYDTGYPMLAAQRFNADGSVDTSFGTNGQTTIPLPSGTIGVSTAPHTVVIRGDGTITFAATLALTGSTATNLTTEGMVVQLTTAGQLDSSFATTGEYLVADSDATASAVALASNGDVLVLGSRLAGADGQLSLTRLTAAGTLNTSFNTSGTLAIPLPRAQQNATATYTPGSLVIAPTGQIYVAGTNTVVQYGLTSSSGANLTRVTASGAIDTTYATNGTATMAPNADNAAAILNSLALQADGKVVLAGYTEDVFTYQGYLSRVNTDGTADATFATKIPAATGPVLNGLLLNSVTVDATGEILVGGSLKYATNKLTLLKLTTSGSLDSGYGAKGVINMNLNPPMTPASAGMIPSSFSFGGMAVTPANKIVVAGGLTIAPASNSFYPSGSQNVLVQFLQVPTTTLPGDFDGDGITDIGVLLTDSSVFAIRPSNGGTDSLTQFGSAGAGNSIPTPGDYDGDGKDDLSVYLPTLGQTAYRTGTFQHDTRFAFGVQGVGASIPAPGDYDGDGTTDQAVYLPATGAFEIKETSGPLLTIPFGTPGPDGSIPAPGDYDGDGRTDIAVYLPALGALAYRPSNGGPDQIIPFGNPGDHMTIPAPGDYDGDGKTDIAAYIPSLAIYAYRPSSGGGDVLASFGNPGAGVSIPAPGDYDGDGKFDLAIDIPAQAIFAYRSSAGNGDILTSFGTPGVGKSVPLTSIPYARYQGSTSNSSAAKSGSGSAAASAAAEALVDLPLIAEEPNQPATRKKSSTSPA